MGQLKIPYNGKLIEGYPIGIDKIILGDLREKKWLLMAKILLITTQRELFYMTALKRNISLGLYQFMSQGEE